MAWPPAGCEGVAETSAVIGAPCLLHPLGGLLGGFGGGPFCLEVQDSLGFWTLAPGGGDGRRRFSPVPGPALSHGLVVLMSF